MRQDYKTICVNVDPVTYNKLKSLVSPSISTVSKLIRMVLNEYVNGLDSMVKPSDPVQPLPISTRKSSDGVTIPQQTGGVIPIVASGGSFTSKVRSGVDMYAVRKAYRAKMRGESYDLDLEQYFDQLNG